MVVIGADFSILQRRRRGDANIIFTLFHLGAHFTQLGRHGEQTVRLLDPPVVDIAQRGGPLREQRGGGDGHRGVRDMVHIHIDSLELAPGTGDEIVAPGDGGAHFFQYVGETNIALYAAAADTGDFHRAALNGASGKEIRGR